MIGIELTGLNTHITISKAVEINIKKKFLYLEEMEDGTFRLTWTKSFIPDMKLLQSLSMIRDKIQS